MASTLFRPCPPARSTSPAPSAAGTAEARLRDWTDLVQDSSDWDRLASTASEPNPFFESWYLLPSLEAFDTRCKVRIFTLEIDGRLAGLIPIRHRWDYYGWPLPQLANWMHANSFLGLPLVGKGHEAAFWQALLSHADSAPGPALFLHLRDMPLAGPLHDALLGVLQQTGRPAGVVQQEERAFLQNDGDGAAYWEASLSARKRKELRRQRKRLGDQGELATVRERTEAGLERWVHDFLALERSGWKGASGSALACDPRTAALFHAALAGAAARGRLERLSLTLNGTPIAMLANFLTPPGAFSYKTAFDERFARFSPGVLLQQENLALGHGPDIAWSDSCASAGHPMIDHIWRERRAIGRLSIAIGGSLRRAAFARVLAAETRNAPDGGSAGKRTGEDA